MRLGHGHRRTVIILWAWTALLCGFVLLPLYDTEANIFIPLGVGRTRHRAVHVVFTVVVGAGVDAVRRPTSPTSPFRRERLGRQGPANGPDQEETGTQGFTGRDGLCGDGHNPSRVAKPRAFCSGLYADHLWHSSPWGLLIGIALGTVAAVTSVVKLVRRYL